MCILYVAKKFKTPGTFQYSLYEELKKYLKKEKTLISADQSKFQIIFSAFQNYEVSILCILLTKYVPYILVYNCSLWL